MINGQNFFNQPIKNDLRAYDNVEKMQLVKEMITLLFFSWTIIISKIIIK